MSPTPRPPASAPTTPGRRARRGLLASFRGSGTPTATRARLPIALVLGAALTALAGPASPAVGQADPCPNAEFRQGVASHLPDCGAYEQVSPVKKSGHDAGVVGQSDDWAGPVSADGSAAAFAAFGPLPGAGAEWGGTGTMQYLSRRAAEGWETTSLQPRPPQVRDVFPYGTVSFSSDLTKSFLFSTRPLNDDPATSGLNFYFQDNLTGALGLAAAFPFGDTGAIAGSGGLESFAFTSDNALTSDPGEAPDGTPRVYEYRGGPANDVRLVSREPGTSDPFAVDSRLGAAHFELSRQSREGAVSDGGDHIFFTAPTDGFDPGRVIYRRSGGAVTAVASPDRRSVPDPNGEQGKVFEVATGDGNRVFFTSLQELTDDANDSASGFFGDLYRYDFAADELVNLSAGTAGSTPADVLGVVDISDDGKRAYFVAFEQVVPGEGSSGGRNLYLWEDDGSAQGTVRFIADLDPSTGAALSDDQNWSWYIDKVAQANSTGRYLVFQSRADLTGYDPAGTSQVYRYDADAAGGGELVCVSCGPGASAPAGHSLAPSFFTINSATTLAPPGDRFPTPVSEDGGVVFSTRNALLGRDTNGRYDAYLWQDGELQLLSTGRSSDDSWAFGISAAGDDAFFRTREKLVPQDVDTLVDLYTARAGGGLPAQHQVPEPACQGEACQGEPGTPPESEAPGSSQVEGSGNVDPRPDPRTCRRLANRAQRHSRRARSLGQRSKRLKRRARRQARSGNDARAKRLRARSRRVSGRAKSTRQRAKRLRRRARNCRQASE